MMMKYGVGENLHKYTIQNKYIILKTISSKYLAKIKKKKSSIIFVEVNKLIYDKIGDNYRITGET